MSLIQIKGEEFKKQIQNLMLEDEKHEVKSFGGRTMFLNSRDRCMVCGGERTFDIRTHMIDPLVGHHVKYFPPEVVWVHYACHKKIHDTENPITLFIQYEEGDARRYYEQKKKQTEGKMYQMMNGNDLYRTTMSREFRRDQKNIKPIITKYITYKISISCENKQNTKILGK